MEYSYPSQQQSQLPFFDPPQQGSFDPNFSRTLPSAAITNSMSNVQSFNSNVVVSSLPPQHAHMQPHLPKMHPQQQHQVHYAQHQQDGTFVPSSLWPAVFPAEGTSIPSASIADDRAFSLESSAAASQLLAEFTPASVLGHNASTHHPHAISVSTVGNSLDHHLPTSIPLSAPSSPHNAGGSESYAAASSTSENPEEALRSNLFVCMLPPTATDTTLLQLFEPFGAVESAKVMLNIHTGQSRGIAFVKFQKSVDALRAMNALDGSMVFQQKITVRIANAKAAYTPGVATKKTFVRNVPATVSKRELEVFFAQFGTVTEISVLPDAAAANTNGTPAQAPHDMQRRTIVFVSFTTKESAKLAADKVHTSMPFPACNGVPLLAKVAEDTVRRNERLSKREVSTSSGSQTMGASATGISSSYPSNMAPPAQVPAKTAAHLIFHPSLHQQQPQQAQVQTQAPQSHQAPQQQAAVYYIQQHQQQGYSHAPATTAQPSAPAAMVQNHNGNLNSNHLNLHHFHPLMAQQPQQPSAPSHHSHAPQQHASAGWYQQQPQQAPQQQQQQQQEPMYLYWKGAPAQSHPQQQHAPAQAYAQPQPQAQHQQYYYGPPTHHTHPNPTQAAPSQMVTHTVPANYQPMYQQQGYQGF